MAVPGDGIYAAWAHVAGERRMAAASIGVRPTFDDGGRAVEAFILDFDGDLYGREVGLEFVSWLRPEERFDTVEALQEQVRRDVAGTRAILENQAASGSEARGTTTFDGDGLTWTNRSDTGSSVEGSPKSSWSPSSSSCWRAAARSASRWGSIRVRRTCTWGTPSACASCGSSRSSDTRSSSSWATGRRRSATPAAARPHGRCSPRRRCSQTRRRTWRSSSRLSTANGPRRACRATGSGPSPWPT